MIFQIIPTIRNSMQWNNKFVYPKSSRSIVQGSRHYSINDELLPSVSTILKATESEEKKQISRMEKQNWSQASRNYFKRSNQSWKFYAIILKSFYEKLNLELLDNTREKMMADQIIENGLRNKLDEIWGCEYSLLSV